MSEMTMVERVCRAMYEDDCQKAGVEATWDREPPSMRARYGSIARAAIAAMRELTPEAIEAACVAMTNITAHGASARLGARTAGERFADGWKAAIDEALR